MRVFADCYGNDADGNRGMMMYEYELDALDSDDVRERLIDKFTGTPIDEIPCYTTIEMYVPDIEDYLEFEVEPFEWLTQEDLKQLGDDYETL